MKEGEATEAVASEMSFEEFVTWSEANPKNEDRDDLPSHENYVVDLDRLRANLRLTPQERIFKMQLESRLFLKINAS